MSSVSDLSDRNLETFRMETKSLTIQVLEHMRTIFCIRDRELFTLNHTKNKLSEELNRKITRLSEKRILYNKQLKYCLIASVVSIIAFPVIGMTIESEVSIPILIVLGVAALVTGCFALEFFSKKRERLEERSIEINLIETFIGEKRKKIDLFSLFLKQDFLENAARIYAIKNLPVEDSDYYSFMIREELASEIKGFQLANSAKALSMATPEDIKESKSIEKSLYPLNSPDSNVDFICH